MFSGLVADPQGTTFDINVANKPDVVGNVLNIGSHFSEKFNLVLADPPYNDRARTIYGTDKFDKRKAIIAIADVVEVGGHLIWLDTMTPIWSKRYWRWGGMIALHTGTNCVIRAVSILRRVGNGRGLFD